MNRFNLSTLAGANHNGFRLGIQRLRLTGIAVVVLIAGLATTTAPDETPRSCKPSAPFAVQLDADPPGTSWRLSVHNPSRDHEVVVWMWSQMPNGSTTDRQRVWSGPLLHDATLDARVSYPPVPGAQRVWAAVEAAPTASAAKASETASADPAPVYRALGAVDLQRLKPAERGVLLTDANTGRLVRQYVGQGGQQ